MINVVTSVACGQEGNFPLNFKLFENLLLV